MEGKEPGVVGKPEEKRKSFEETGVLEGARVLSAFVVLFHHIGALDRDLWDPEALASASGVNRTDDNRLLQTAARANGNLIWHIFGIGPGHLAVEVFLVIAGFVAAFGVWSRIGESSSKQDYESRGEYEQRIGFALLKRFQKSLLLRFWRLGPPLIPVQILHFALWKNKLAYGPYLTFPASEEVRDAYDIGIRALWAFQLSGSLWIIETLFFAPFVVLALILPIQTLSTAPRWGWYLSAIVYFSGNLVERRTYSYNTGIVMGAALADLFYHHAKSFRDDLSSPWKAVIFSMAAVCVSFPWWRHGMYGHHYSMVVSAAAFVFLALFAPPVVQKVLNNKVVKFYSPFSYQLYIWHVLILSIFAVNVQPIASKGVLYIFGFGTCLIWAPIAYLIFELPSVSFGNLVVQAMLGNRKSQRKEIDLPEV